MNDCGKVGNHRFVIGNDTLPSKESINQMCVDGPMHMTHFTLVRHQWAQYLNVIACY